MAVDLILGRTVEFWLSLCPFFCFNHISSQGTKNNFKSTTDRIHLTIRYVSSYQYTGYDEVADVGSTSLTTSSSLSMVAMYVSLVAFLSYRIGGHAVHVFAARHQCCWLRSGSREDGDQVEFGLVVW
jgi:hypothetical protein